MKVKRPSEPDAVHPDADDDDMRALDQSEKEYSRMISQHATYHKMLMDDLITLSSGSGSGSGSGMMLEPGPAQQMLQQQMDQSKQTNLINGIGTTIGRMNSNRDQLMQSASKFAGKSPINSQTVARLNDSIRANGSDVLKTIHATTATKAPNATKATKATKATEGFAPNPTLDGALEVSTITRESHKYALVIFGIFASFLVYKTIKHL
jgi:hypothetical protein